MSFDLPATYRTTRERLTPFIVGLDEKALRTPVPATPLWSIQDLFAHLTGVASDVVTGRMDGAVSPVWTQRQVDERRDRSITEIADEWSDLGPRVETLLGEVGAPMSATVMDVWMHEHDVYGALGVRPHRDGEGLRLCLRAANAIGPRLDSVGLPTLRLQTDGYDRTVGNGEAGITVGGDPFEIARALFGRRSARQIAAFDWSDDSDLYVTLFSVFEPRETDLVE
ncbi:MAG: maleylpyruvate isomerase family mycothiol-dependent enzyme [Actinomycetota bacterium]|nr:maleylpyruvate isomerase family mycothiol-dependent enzyme [Actinomycetota bacterium]